MFRSVSRTFKCWTLVILVLALVLTALNLYSCYRFEVTVTLYNASERNYPLVYLKTDGTYDKAYSYIHPDLSMHYRLPPQTVRFMIGDAYSFVDLAELNYPPFEYFKAVAVNGIAVQSYDELPKLMDAVKETRAASLWRLFIVLAVGEIILAALVMRFHERLGRGLRYLGMCWRTFWRRPAFTGITARLDAWERRWHNAKLWRALTQTRVLKFLILLVICALVLVWRRSDQVWQPYIWSEDGSHILWQYILFGMQSFTETTNGSYIFSSKLINILAYKISFWYYPEIAAWLSNLFIVMVVCAVAYAPTHLKAPWWCAVAVLFVKTGAECFSVALYSFWWAGLLLILAVMWRNDRRFILRLVFVLVGGFSSPIILGASPLFIILAALTHNKRDIVTAAVGLIPFFCQLNRSLAFGGTSPVNLLTLDTWLFATRNFLGTFVNMYGGYAALSILGLVLLVIIVLAGFRTTPGVKTFLTENRYYLMLFLWLLTTIASSIYRMPVMLETAAPFFAPYQRYFFYPSIILAWLAIWLIAASGNKFPRVLVKVFLVLTLFNFLYLGYCKEMRITNPGDLNWRVELCKAVAGDAPDPYPIELYYFGIFENDYAEKLAMPVPKEQYLRLIRESWLYNDVDANCRGLSR